MLEVEAQAVGGDERAGLLHVRAQHLAQRRVQQVGGRVIAAGGISPFHVNVRRHQVAKGEPAFDVFYAVHARQARAEARHAGDARALS